MVTQKILRICIILFFILLVYSMKDSLDCYNLLNAPKQYKLYTIISSLDSYPIVGMDDTGNYVEKHIRRDYNGYSNIVDHFSYFALVNCDNLDTGNETDMEPINGPIDVKYMNLHLLNTVTKCKELRYPYNNSQTIYIIVTVISAVLMLCGLFEYYKLKSETRNHWVALIFVVAIISFFFFCLFSMSAYIQSCKDGRMDNELMGIAIFFQALHEAFFILHILLLCKGWGLFKHKISIKERMIIGCYFMSYLILIMNSMYWKYFRSEIYDDQNFFVTPPGIIYLVVRLLSFFLIHRNLYHSIPNDSLIDNKFILVVYVCGIVYIFSPCVGCLISLGVKDYVKYYVVDVTNTVISTFIYLVLVIFYFPSQLTKSICPNYFSADPMHPAYQESYMKDDVTGKIEHGFSLLVQIRAKLIQIQKQCVGFNAVIEKTVHELGLDPNTYIAHNNTNPVPTLSYAKHEEILRRAKGGRGGGRRGGRGGGGGKKERLSSSQYEDDDRLLLPKAGGNKMLVNNDVAGSMRGPKDDSDDDSDNDNNNNSDNDENNNYGNNINSHHTSSGQYYNRSHHSNNNSNSRRKETDDNISDVEYNNNVNNGRISHGAPINKDPFEHGNSNNNNSGSRNKRHTSSDRRDHSEITTPMSNKHSNSHHNSNSNTPNRYYNDRNQQDREYDLSGNRMRRELSRHNDIMPKNSFDDNNDVNNTEDGDYHRPRIDSNGNNINRPPPINTDPRRQRGRSRNDFDDNNEDNNNNNHKPPLKDQPRRMSRDNYGNSNNYYDNNYTDFRPPRDSSSTKHRDGGGGGGRTSGKRGGGGGGGERDGREGGGAFSTSQTSNRSSQPRRLEPISRNSSNRNSSGTRLEPIGRSSGNNRNEVDVINLGGRRTPLNNEYKNDFDDEDDYHENEHDNEPNPLLDALN